MAAGAILATLSVEALTRRLPQVPLMLGGWLAMVPLLMVPVIWPRLDVVLAAWTIGGFCTMTGNVLAMTLLQRLTPGPRLPTPSPHRRRPVRAAAWPGASPPSAMVR